MFKSIIAHFVIFVISLASEAIAEDYPSQVTSVKSPLPRSRASYRQNALAYFFIKTKMAKQRVTSLMKSFIRILAKFSFVWQVRRHAFTNQT